MVSKYLIFIFFLALIFRFWQVTSYPVSLTLDETEIGYNAYSLIKTGHDTWNAKLPLVFKSVGDYKPPVNFYLSVPPIFFLGLTEFSVRFTSALLGALSVVVMYLLIRYLGFSSRAGLATSLFLAFLPWHVHFSRAGFEAVTALFFLLLGVTTFVRKKYASSAFSFSMSVWAYHAERFFVPFLFIFLLIYFKPKISKLIFPSIVLIIFSIPFLYLFFFTPAIRERASSTSILRESSLTRHLHKGNYENLSQMIFDHDIYLIFHHWAGKYTDYFDLRFIFWKGLGLTPPGYPDTGLLYFVDFPIFILGLIGLVKKSPSRFTLYLTLFWLLVGPMPASFAMNNQHALRALIWLPAFAIIMAFGFQKILKTRWFYLYFLLLIFNIFYVADIYFKQTFRFYSEHWQYGFKQAALYGCQNKDKYQEIIMSEVFGTEGPVFSGIPYSYVLFYCKYDPAAFQATQKIAKFSFRRVNWIHDSDKPNTLLISSQWDYVDGFPPKENVLGQVNYLNGHPAFMFVTTNKDIK